MTSPDLLHESTRRRYRVLEVLGEGGFGKVYRAELLGGAGFVQQVALKVVNPSQPQADEALRRLRDEARILGLVQHRAVVRAFGLARLEMGWAAILEYVDGIDCAELAKQHDVPLRVAVEIAEEVAGALVAVWGTSGPDGAPLHVLHRDIKPANIRVTHDGVVKVLDFGAAQARFDARESSTRSHILGSLRYMAPERFLGADGPGVDVYALGLTLVELLTRIPPSDGAIGELEQGRMRMALVRALRERIEEDGPEQAAAAQSLASLVDRMLAHSPDARPSAAEVVDACKTLRNTLEGPALRDWRPAVVAPPRPEASAAAGDPWSGSLLLELPGEVTPRPPAIPNVTVVAPPRRFPLAVVAAGVGVLAATGVCLGGGGILISRSIGTKDAQPVDVEPVPVEAPAAVPPEVPQPTTVAPVAPAPARVGGAAPRAPRPAPVAELVTAPAPAPPAAAVDPRVHISIAGDATSVTLSTGGRTVRLPTDLPPGRYPVSASFAGGEEWSGQLSLDGESATISCSAEFVRCRRE